MITNQKKVFFVIFLGFTVFLAILPFVVTANEMLTRIVERNVLYLWIQAHIIPLEAKMMGVLLLPFGYRYAYSPTNSTILVNGLLMRITWNCLGWQSFLLFFLTFVAGFRGRYTRLSILEAFGIGVLGTFWLNILRMLFTVLLAVHFPSMFRIVFHDYLAAGTTVVWLFGFWWFSYAYVLEEAVDKVHPCQWED